MSRQPNAARETLLANCVAACTGRIAAAGSKPGIAAINRMPPPIPITAASAEVNNTMGIKISSSMTSTLPRHTGVLPTAPPSLHYCNNN